MDTKDAVLLLERLGAMRASGYVLVVAAIFAPAILSLFWFDRELFIAFSTTKIILLSGSIGTLTCLSVAYPAAKIAEPDRPTDNLHVVVIVSIGLATQLFAICLSWFFGAIGILIGSSVAFRSTAGVAALSILIGVVTSVLSWRQSKDDAPKA